MASCAHQLWCFSATLLGIEKRKGVIALNADADLVLISENVEVLATYVSGGLVYANSW